MKKNDACAAPDSGFALIGVMIVVAAVVALPKLAHLIRRASGGESKGRVESSRSARSIYYGDMEGQYPADMAALTVAGK